MTQEKELGKITHAEFGFTDRDIFGLHLSFEFGGSGCSWTEGQHFWRHEPRDEEDIEYQRKGAEVCSRRVAEILKDAKVDHVSKLKGKPVEVTTDGEMLKSWRILTEVL